MTDSSIGVNYCTWSESRACGFFSPMSPSMNAAFGSSSLPLKCLRYLPETAGLSFDGAPSRLAKLEGPRLRWVWSAPSTLLLCLSLGSWFLFKSYCSREACQGGSSPSLVSSSTVCSLPLSPGNSPPGLSVWKDCSLYLKTSLDPVELGHVWKHDFHL